MATTDTVALREALRIEIKKDLLERFEANYRQADELVEEDGVSAELPANLRVLTRKDVLEIVDAAFAAPLPAPSDHHAEVSTPATVTVATICPECNLPGRIAVGLTAELLVTPDDPKELRVKAKTKGKVHVCGQLELPDEHSNGQLTLEGAAEAPEAVAKHRYDLDYAAARPGDVATTDDVCIANVMTPDGELECYRPAGHGDELHWDEKRGHGWRLRLDVEGMSIEPLRDLLLLVCHGDPPMPSIAAIEGWDQATRDEVATWASAVHLAASDHDDIVVPDVPAALTVAVGEAIAETLPGVDKVLAGEVHDDDRGQVDDALLPGGPAILGEHGPELVVPAHDTEIVQLRCVGNNHVPGCEHMGGKVPPKRGARK